MQTWKSRGRSTKPRPRVAPSGTPGVTRGEVSRTTSACRAFRRAEVARCARCALYNEIWRIVMADQLVIAGRAFNSRLIVGTGKYRSFDEMRRAHQASGAEMVTVAVRRVNLTDKSKESLLDYIDRENFFILPNTAGCYTADEAVRTARLGREVGLSEWVKLEVIGDQQTLFPDTEQLIAAT